MTRYTYSNQEAFDKVAVALVAQGERSMGDDDHCAYGASNGFRCAAGHLLPEPTPEKVLSFVGDWFSLTGDYPEYKTIVNYDLVRMLQDAHDNHFNSVESLAEEMRAIARDLNLNTVALDHALSTKGV